MQRQAVPLLVAEPPIVATGMERDVPAETAGPDEKTGVVVALRLQPEDFGHVKYASEATIVEAARLANAAMPSYAAGLLDGALGGLAGARVVVLGAAYRGGVKETAFSGVFPLVAALRDVLVDADCCLLPWPQDPNPDHSAVGKAVLAAAPVTTHCWSYPIWMWHWARPGDPRVPWQRAIRVPLTPAAAGRKRAARRRMKCGSTPRRGRASSYSTM